MRATKFSAVSVSAVCSVFAMSVFANAGPIRVSEVKQIVSGNSTRSILGGSTKLIISRQNSSTEEQQGADSSQSDDSRKSDQRVITEEVVEIAEEPCACAEPEFAVAAFESGAGRGFPWWALGFGAVPIAFVGGDQDSSSSPNSTPTPINPPSGTPPSPTTSPSPSLSPSPSASPLPQPSVSPTITGTPTGTPPPEVPEPATILLFGTGLTSLGFAARRRWTRKSDEDEKTKE